MGDRAKYTTMSKLRYDENMRYDVTLGPSRYTNVFDESKINRIR